VRVNSEASTIIEITSPVDPEKAGDWSAGVRAALTDGDRSSKDSDMCEAMSPKDSAAYGQIGPALPSLPPVMRPETRDGLVPKTRLSGGLAEMGELSLQDTTQGWPIYWR
jgi:hypothetical protein